MPAILPGPVSQSHIDPRSHHHVGWLRGSKGTCGMLVCMRLRHLAAAAASVLVLSACSLGGPGGKEPPEKVEGRLSPLTGLPQEQPPNNPPFVVKIENTAAGQPQYGLNQADFVVEELVEGGLTRLAAVFYSQLPTKVGHVRSTRTTDIGLALPVNGTIVASGGDKRALDKIKAAKVRIFTYDAGAPGFSKDPSKSAPYHVLWDLKKLNETAPNGEIPHKGYFQFGAGPTAADVDKKTTSVSVTFSPATTTDWRYAGGKWTPTTNRAASGQEFKADTLVVIFAPVKDAGYNDAAGNPVPETVLEGSGRAVVFSGDSAVEATWRKSTRASTMILTSEKSGKPITIKPGRVFLEAATRGGEVKY